MKRRYLAAAVLLCMLLAAVTPQGARAEATLTTATVLTNGTPLRKTASENGAVLKKLDAGTVVTVLDANVNAEWDRVSYGKVTGYVNRMELDISASMDSYCLTGTGVIVNCNSFVNVRSEPNTKSRKLGTAAKDSTVVITRANCAAGWHQIEYSGGTGYVSSGYVRFTPTAEADQLTELTVTGGTLSPAFSPREYGYVMTATEGQVTVKVAAAEGVKLSVDQTGATGAKYTINSGNSKTIRISVNGRVRYTIYLVRDVLTVGTWNIKRGNENLIMQGWLIGNQRPDIMGIQEVYMNTKDRSPVNNLASIRTKNMQHATYAPTIDYDSGAQYGIGVLSAYKAVSAEQFDLPDSGKEPRTLQKVVYDVGGKTVSFYNTHFSYESASIRKKQFAEVLKIMSADENEYKILTGDFNAEESEFASFKKDYRIVNTSATKFYDYTGKRISVNQIDNILVTKNITVLNARTIPNEYSDHYPLFAFIRLK